MRSVVLTIIYIYLTVHALSFNTCPSLPLSLSPLLQMFVSKAAVGSIVGLQSAQIQQMASEYQEKVRGHGSLHAGV